METRITIKNLTLAFVIFSIFSCSSTESDQSAPPGLSQAESIRTTSTAGRLPRIAPTICNYDLDETALTSSGWTKVFEDDFNGDLSKWNVWTGGAFNNELQHYQAANLQVSNGILQIVAKKETVTGATNPFDPTPKTFDYTSGRIECKTNVSANASTPKVRMIARMKLASGYGMWPAFWSYGDPWPTQGEIDIVEARGQEPKQYQNNYFYGTSPGTNLVRHGAKVFTADADLQQCYHVYEMIWEQSQLTSILDGTVIEVKTSGGYIPALFGKEERVTLNLAVGGAFFSRLDPAKIQTGTLHVDWVKVFTSN